MSTSVAAAHRLEKPAASLFVFPLRLFHLWLNLPTCMFLVTLTAMLFRAPDLKSFPIDRVACVALVFLISIRLSIRREPLQTYRATWPLVALMLLGLWGTLTQPYDSQSWSVFTAKWVVPCVLFHVSGVVFHNRDSLRKLEMFLLIVLTYLTAVSIMALFGANSFIFPRFIADAGIGIHADRARGPFLQAVANGLCLNLLGLVALDSYRRNTVRGLRGSCRS